MRRKPRDGRDDSAAQQLSDPVFRFGRGAGGSAKEFEEAVTLGVASALFEECGGGFDDADLFGDGSGDPLVQRDAVFFGEALRGLFHGMGKLQRVSRSAHGFTLAYRRRALTGARARTKNGSGWGIFPLSFAGSAEVRSTGASAEAPRGVRQGLPNFSGAPTTR